MNKLKAINECILELLKSSKINEEMALLMLKEVNRNAEHKQRDIAVIGIACRFPGANDINRFWDNLAKGICSIGVFPEERLQDLMPFMPDLKELLQKSGHVAGYLDQISYFDHKLFNISYQEALAMEPYQRVFMETAYKAILNAGYGKKELKNTSTGIYVGFETAYQSYYSSLLPQQDILTITGSLVGLLSNRLSYFLDLRGPALVINTACSSGLVALHEACVAIKNKECDMALAGGVNLMVVPQIAVRLNDLETTDGKVKAFDKNADGTVWSEGVAALLLKPLDNALRDGNKIYAIIKGSCVNSDGASNGLTAPNPEAETKLLIDAWEKANIDPLSISYIEAHGTGTLLGDSIELQAINDAFRKYTNKKHICGIGSVKTNIGHTVAASGLASLIKVILSLQRKKIPPSLNFENPNPFINFNDSAIYVNSVLKDWKSENGPLRAGVNSFGISGTNCHVVVEEAPYYDPKQFQENGRKTVEFEKIKIWPLPSEKSGAVFAKEAIPRERMYAQKTGDSIYYCVKWFPADSSAHMQPVKEEMVLLISDDTEWGNSLAAELASNNQKVIHARIGVEYKKIDPSNYFIRADEGDINELIKCTAASGFAKVVLAAGIDFQCGDSCSIHDTLLKNTLYSLFYLNKALGNNNIGNMQIVLLGKNAQAILGNETSVNPWFAAAFGLGKVIREEHSGINCRCVDFDDGTPVKDIAAQILDNSPHYNIAIRQGKKLYPRLVPLEIGSIENGSIRFKDRGVYLITGGTGGIGLEIAKYISKNNKVRLVLLGRSILPPREAWDSLDDKDRQRIAGLINAVECIEENGTEVCMYSADVSKEDELRRVIEEIKSRYGRIDGIIHAAGVPGSGLLAVKDSESFSRVIAPKIKGTWLLHRLTCDNPPDFIILFSSIASLVGGIFLGDYVAANCYLDAYSGIRTPKTRILAINWTTWENTGMARNTSSNLDAAFKAISPPDAVKAFDEIIKKDLKNIIIGEINYNNNLFWNGQLPFELAPDIRKRIKAPGTETEVTLTGRDNNVYTDIEKQIAHIWGNVFRFSSIDIYDNFYELGGTSIICIKIINQINEKFGITLEIKDVFTHLTIADLSEFVAKKISEKDPDNTPQVTDRGVEKRVMPLSHSQKRIWFLQKLNPGLVAYNLPFIRILNIPVDIDKFKRAVSYLVRKHAILRTYFYLKDGNPVQEVLEEYTPSIEIIDLSGQKDQQLLLDKDIYLRKMKPFDLETPPYRIYLYKLAEDCFCIYINFHHIIVDGWSIDIFYRQLFSTYNAVVNNESIVPDSDSIDYFDWITEQAEWEQSEDAKKQLEYWLGELAKPLPVLNLPIDKKRPAVQTYEGSYFKFKIEGELLVGLKRHTEKYHITMNNCLLSVFFLLLHKLAQEDDIIVGLPAAGRNQKKWEEVIGIFINTLCIRINFDGISTFMDLQEKVKEKVINAIDKARYPFDLLVEKVNPDRDLSRNPIYSVLFQFYDKLHLDNDGISQFELSCLSREAEDGIEVSFEYNTDLFTEATIAEFAEYFLHIVEQVVANPFCRIGQIRLMTEEKQINLLDRLKPGEISYDEQLSVHKLFEMQAEKSPEAVALVFENDVLTYRQLNEKANQLAWLLIERGIRKNSPVCLLADRGFNVFIGILAILKAGGAYVPIDPGYPEARVKYILDNSNAEFLLTEPKFMEKVDGILDAGKQSVLIIGPDGTVEKAFENRAPDTAPKSPCCNDNPSVGIRGADLMYIIYTSGSTGNPKGVKVTHSNVINFILWSIGELKLGPDDVLMLVTSISFDISVFEMFGTLLSGAKVCIVSNEKMKDAALLIEYMEANKVNIWHSVPSMMVQLLTYLKNKKDRYQGSPLFSRMRHIMLGGEAWSTRLSKQIRETFPDAEIRNMYGPTETTIWITSYKAESELDEEKHPVMLIGKPISNNQVIIFDKYMNVCAPGISGEIYITGKNVTGGYYGDEERTKAAFIILPDGRTYYKTGDVGRYLQDGNIEFLGRKDNMVKVRGYRVELGEIENALRETADLGEILLTTVREEESNKIVCFYTSEKQYSMQDLKAILRQKLPEYMIPAQFYHVDAIELTPNGKTDWKAMAVYAESNEGREYKEVRNEFDSKLAGIWKKLLNLSAIGIDENFFDIGGNSILIVQMQDMIKEEFSQEISIIDLFRYTSIEALSDYLSNNLERRSSTEVGQRRADLRKKMRKLRG